MNVGDLVEHHAWDNDVYVITSVCKRDPYTGVDSIELQFMFCKDATRVPPDYWRRPPGGLLVGKRYVGERIFVREWRNVCSS